MNDKPPRHICEGTLPNGHYGQAIKRCEERSDETLWVDNDEYASQVNFCPYCGYKAPVQAGIMP